MKWQVREDEAAQLHKELVDTRNEIAKLQAELKTVVSSAKYDVFSPQPCPFFQLAEPTNTSGRCSSR